MSTKRILLQGVFPPEILKRLGSISLDEVYVLEGRPHLTSLRENCRILQSMGLTPTVLADNMTGYLFSKQLVDEVWMAYRQADRKGMMAEIGGLTVAILANEHHIPVRGFRGAATGPVFGKAQDLQHFNGQVVVAGRVKAFVPLCEWVPVQYTESIHE